MQIDIVSDLHSHFPELPGGDMVIVCGDLTARDLYQEYVFFAHWLERQNYRHKIIIGGNHDALLEKTDLYDDLLYPFTYLLDEGIEIDGLQIWGSPWTQSFLGMNPKCNAFTFDFESQLQEKFALIPDDCDILITHSPPYYHLDETRWFEHVGSKSLLNRVDKIKPSLHCFGHIHEAYGVSQSICTTFVNASHVNEKYQPVNPSIRVEI